MRAFSAAAGPSRKYKVGVLGATGAVGQRFLQYLDGHPWFEVVYLGASSRSAGKPYSQATQWNVSANCPAGIKSKVVTGCTPKDMPGVDFVFSALVRVPGVDLDRVALSLRCFANALRLCDTHT